METYLVLGKFTRQGIQNVRETTQRSERFREIAEKFGVKVKEIYWLLGDYDVINIVEAPDGNALQALLVYVGAWGNVRTTTLRAFNKKEMDGILEKTGANA